MLIKTPDELFKNLWQRIPKNTKIAFLSSLIIGIITHVYMLTNTLPNHDEFKNMAESLTWGIAGTGRWFLPIVGAITGIFTLPWINGLLTIVFFSISACLVVSMAKVKKPLYCMLISGIMVTIPMVASFLTYMGGAPANVSTIMLACIAVYIAHRYKYGYIFAVIPIVLSLATYQISFSLAAALFILVLMLEILRNETPWQKTLFNGIRYLGTLIGSLVVYIASIRVLHPQGLEGDYQGLGQMGQIDWSYLPFQIRTAYIEIIKFFLEDSRNYHYPFMSILFVLSFFASAILVLLWCHKKNLFKEPMKIVLLVILMILFPLACNLIFILGPHWIHDMMIYPTVLVPVFMIIIVDMLKHPKDDESIADRKTKLSNVVSAISAWVITLTMTISIFNYAILSNQVYFKLNIGYQVTYAESIMLISAIQNVEGFSPDMDIVLVGSKYIPQGIPELQYITIMGANGPELLLDSWAYPYFLQRHLNFTQNLTHVRGGDIWVGKFHEDQHIIDLVNLVEDMPPYPQYGSIRIIDDTIFVRFYHLDMPHYRPF